VEYSAKEGTKIDKEYFIKSPSGNPNCAKNRVERFKNQRICACLKGK
jgi:hypothetical protein